MKKIIIISTFLISAFFCQTAFAQFKIHSNGRMTLQSTINSAGQGVAIEPYPSWTTTFNGDVHFTQEGIFRKVTGPYTWISSSVTSDDHAAAWVVSRNWNAANFYVYGKGDAYAKHYYTISHQQGSNSKGEGTQLIEGAEALTALSGLKGYYFAPEEIEIPDLENNENVDPEAVEAMYNDFRKRSAGLLGNDFVEAFPEGVRTDPWNRLCIDYSAVVTLLVEAVKEQHAKIEQLEAILKDNGLLKP